MTIDLSKISYQAFLIEFGYDPDLVASAIAQAGSHYDGDLWQLTIGDLSKSYGALAFDLSDDKSAAAVFQAINAIKAHMDDFGKLLEQYQVPLTGKEQAAATGLPEYNETEGLLVFARNYFGLKSFTEAERVTLADVLLAKKDAYITAMYERNLNKQYRKV